MFSFSAESPCSQQSQHHHQHLLTSALRFAAAVGISYGFVWMFSSTFSASSALPVKSKNVPLKDGPKSSSCISCLSKLKSLVENQSDFPHQAQLHIALLERLVLRDGGIDLSQLHHDSGEKSCCTCNSRSIKSVPVPIIPVSPSCRITSLDTPATFYDTLLHKIISATRRIVISSLYIGSGPRSKFLVGTLREKLLQNPKLELTIVLDYCRMRVGPNLEAIRPIVEAIEENCRKTSGTSKSQSVSLFCPPSALGLMFCSYGRVREAQGVQHTKIFVFDDSAILSGANLSDDYFLDRMDRYVLLNGEEEEEHGWDSGNGGCPELADYMTDVAKTLSSVSFELVPVASSTAPAALAGSRNEDAPLEVFCGGSLALKKNSFGFGPNQPAAEAKKIHAQAMQKLLAATSMPLCKWIAAVEQEVENGNNSRRSSSSSSSAKTFVVPSVQFARAGVFTDLSVMETVLSFELKQHKRSSSSSCSSSLVQRVIASPYLNTHESFVDSIFSYCERAKNEQQRQQQQQPEPAFRFVTCSPNSNAWKGSSGAAGKLPQLYYSLVRSFFFLVEDRKLSAQIELREFEKHHLVDPKSGSYFDLPECATASAFSPYVRPDDEDLGKEAAAKAQQEFAEQQRQKMTHPSRQGSVSSSAASSSSFAARSPAQSSPPMARSPSSSTMLRSCSTEEVALLKKTHSVASATFHAKGMWVLKDEKREEEEEEGGGKTMVPFATVVGSNNLGERCVFKDVECDFLLVTADAQVQRVLAAEADAILRDSEPVSRDVLLSNSSEKLGRFQPVVEVVGSMMSSYL